MVLFREWSSRCFLDLPLVPIIPIIVASKSFCWYLMVLFREWSCWWFLDIILIHIFIGSEILAFSKVETAKGVVDAWTWCFGYALFRSVFGFRWCWVLVRVSEFCYKYNQPDLIRVRIRRFHCAKWDHFTFSSWFYWWLILQFNVVFPRVSEEMIFKKINLNTMFCAFLSLQYWTPCLPALLRLFESSVGI